MEVLIPRGWERNSPEDWNSTRTATRAGSGSCWGAHRVAQEDAKADFLGPSQHPQVSPAAMSKLGPARRA